MDCANLISFGSNCASISRHRKLTTVSCRASRGMASKNKTNFYKVLSVEPATAGSEDIRKAYRSLALRYHPDVCPPSKKEESTRMFVELHRAYETLSDPALRREHDLELDMAESESFTVRSDDFPRETWEAQLRELMRRSERRERAKAGFWRK